MAIDRVAEERSRRYRREIQFKRAVSIVSYIVLLFVTSILIMLVCGETFDPILRMIGLKGIYVREDGIYADCSRKENRGSPYCQPKLSQADKQWQALKDTGGRTTPFALSKDY
jgi:hypothetical protein